MHSGRTQTLFQRFPQMPVPLLAALFVTVTVGTGFFVIQPTVYTNDSGGYLEGARALIGDPEGKYSYWRTPLFLALMATTGVATERSLRGLVFAQYLFGLAMPILIYSSLARVDKWLAAAASILAAVSIIPFANIGYVMPNQFYYLFVVLAMFYTCRYVAAARPNDVFALALAAFGALMVRPQGNYLSFVLLGVAFLATPRQWRRCVAAGALVIALQFAYMVSRPLFADSIAPTRTVLLSDLTTTDLIPDDVALYRRALLFVRENFTEDARAIGAFITDRSLASEVRLAALLQAVLVNDHARAEREALQEPDPQARDQALFYLGARMRAAGDTAGAERVNAAIRSAEWRGKARRSSAEAVQIPILTDAAPKDGEIQPLRFVGPFDLTDTGGKMLFFPILLTQVLAPGAYIQPDYGPASAELYRILNTYLRTPGVIERTYPNVERFMKGRPVDARWLLTDFGSAATEVHWTIWQILDRLIGPTAANKLLQKVFVEFAKTEPAALGKVYLLMFLRAVTAHPIEDPFVSAHTLTGLFGPLITLPGHPDVATVPAFQRDVERSKRFEAAYVAFSQYYVEIFTAVTLSICVLSLFGFMVIRERQVFLLYLVCMLIAAHQIGVCTLTAGTGYPYISIAYLLLIVADCIVIYAVILRIGAGKILRAAAPA